jgi:hypothetical protein
MTDSASPIDALEALGETRARVRADRRRFFGAAAGMVGMGLAAGAALGLAGSAAAQTTTLTDADVLNFALNLEYLEAQFYSFATGGGGLAAAQLTGTGTQGAATGGRTVDFSGDPIIGRMAREIAADEAAHVAFLRAQLGSAAVAQPAIDLSAGAAGAFSKAAQAAGVVASGAAFDPYASIDNFLLAAYLFEDVGVTAYKGGASLLTSKTYLEAAAGLLAVEAYHAATIRAQIYTRGQSNAALLTYAQQLSDARDALDGGTDLDQGLAEGSIVVTNADSTTTTYATSNIVPTNANSVVYDRSPGQVLSIVYLATGASSGGFFPSGVNGTVKTGSDQ